MVSKTILALCVCATVLSSLLSLFAASTSDCRDPTGECDTNSISDLIYKQFNLKSHLEDFNVPDKVYTLLEGDGIRVNDLTSFRIKGLDGWCHEHSLKIIERTRFIKAVKALPNAQANEEITESTVKPYLRKELKKIQENTNNMAQRINDVCDRLDKLEVFVKQFRNNSLNQVSCVHITAQ